MIYDEQASKDANADAVERIKREQREKTSKQVEETKAEQEEGKDSEETWFEDGAGAVKLLDGKVYKIYPVNLKKARRLLQLMQTVNVDAAVVNFASTGDIELDAKREEEFIELIMMAFDRYEVDRDYIEENVDVVKATKIAGILLGINGLKK